MSSRGQVRRSTPPSEKYGSPDRKVWQGPVQRDPDHHPHHVSRMVKTMEVILNPHSTIEKKLWGATTLRRCLETTPEQGQVVIRENTLVPAVLCYLIRSVDGSDTGARVKEHALLSLLHLLGQDPAYDEKVFYDHEVQDAVIQAMYDPHVVVATAAIQVVRRVSECTVIASWLVYNEPLFDHLLELMEVCDDERIAVHCMNAFLNLSSLAQLSFPLSRCARLLQLLLEMVDHAENHPSRAEISAKTFANLLSHPDNVSEVLRLVPSLVNSMIEASCQADRAPGLAAAARHVLEYIHDGDIGSVETAVSHDFVQGRATASRLRSPLVSSRLHNSGGAAGGVPGEVAQDQHNQLMASMGLGPGTDYSGSPGVSQRGASAAVDPLRSPSMLDKLLTQQNGQF